MILRLCIIGMDLFLTSFCVSWCNFIILISIFLISWIILFLVLVNGKENISDLIVIIFERSVEY